MNQFRPARATALIAALAAVSLGLTGCAVGGSSSDDGGSASDATLVVGLDAEPDCLDPGRTSASSSFQVTNLIYETLLRNVDGKFEPGLATSYEKSDDGLTYTFTLRTGVTFQDGTDFNADAVVWNLERVVDPKTQSRQAAALLGPFKSATAVSDDTVKVTLDKPYAPFLSGIANPALGMVSPTAVKKSSDAWICKKPVGTGLFKLDSWSKGSDIQLSRFDDYAPRSGSVESNVAHVDLRMIPEQSVRLGSLSSGEVQVITGVPASRTADVKKDDGVKLVSGEPQGTPYMLLINVQHKPWDNVKARTAIQLGIDWNKIVEQMYGGAFTPATSILTPTTLGFKSAPQDLLAYDPEKANELLDSLGYTSRDGDGYRVKDGKRLTFNWIINSTNRDMRQEIIVAAAAQAKKIGVQMTEQKLAVPALLAALQDEPNGKYDGYGVAYSGFDPDILRLMFSKELISTATQLGKNHARVENSELEGILNKTESEVDDSQRAKYFQQAQKIILNQHYAVPIYNSKEIVGYQSNEVTGITMDNGSLLDLMSAKVSG